MTKTDSSEFLLRHLHEHVHRCLVLLPYRVCPLACRGYPVLPDTMPLLLESPPRGVSPGEPGQQESATVQ